MRICDYTKSILLLAVTLHRWLGDIAGMEPARQQRVADYATAIADTLARAAENLGNLERHPGNVAARRQAIRELGRICGYVETIVDVLQHRLDGRKLAGVKRRLETLGAGDWRGSEAITTNSLRIDRLTEAEGYFRALADGLRA